MKQGKRSLCILLVCMILLAMCPIHAFAAGLIQPDRKVTLNISYKDEDKAISNAQFSIFKVADVDEYADMTLTSDFEAYRDTVTGLSNLDHLTRDEWLSLASSLQGYVLNDALVPAAKGETDGNGMLSFSDLEVGLYLVIGSRVTTDDDYTYACTPFMVFLPGEDTENKDWNYDVTVVPKFTKVYTPPEEDDSISRKVLKKWDDAGYEAHRPAEVVVQLLKDGEVYDTKTLNKDNNWRYTWDDLDADYDWEVIEKKVEGYTSSIVRNGITFTITNVYAHPNNPPDNPPDKPEERLPQTGLLWWPVPLLLCAGLAFVMIGMIRRRKYN